LTGYKGCPLEISLSSLLPPEAAGEKKKVIGDTPNPGRGEPLHPLGRASPLKLTPTSRSDRNNSFLKGKYKMATHEMIVTKHVYAVLREYLGNSTLLLPDSDLLHDLGMDSLEQVELGLKLEKDFGIKIPVADLRGCVTIEEVIQLVERIASQKGAQHTTFEKEAINA
jgi:acyl carrier protein